MDGVEGGARGHPKIRNTKKTLLWVWEWLANRQITPLVKKNLPGPEKTGANVPRRPPHFPPLTFIFTNAEQLGVNLVKANDVRSDSSYQSSSTLSCFPKPTVSILRYTT